ncbi:hypothetical protein OVN20_07785 [Microcella daejeonensis]|uniref:toxin-antitoxin system YwqK family antitoxin n=1 Tax=Microcella daejeonensis TaxID=2994971 RepID=UPI00226D89FB|nr:hypothetical protein [Microcella daejeonensis]WAB83008.1 hypothetical protein OVN20_07785 [Microcella daejeonensis]
MSEPETPPPRPTPPDRIREEHHRDGTLKARGGMLGDELHGPWQWWRADGSLMRSGAFDRGRQVGEWTTHDRHGAPVRTTSFGD